MNKVEGHKIQQMDSPVNYLARFDLILVELDSMAVNLRSLAQPAKLDLNKKSFSKQKAIRNFTIDAQGFRKTKNENPPTWEIEVTS